jgi:hypothetical protein
MSATAGLIAGITQTGNAGEWDQKTIFTFRAPVEIPGQVLEVGAYAFELADSSGGRNIVQVFSKDEDRLYGVSRGSEEVRYRKLSLEVVSPSDVRVLHPTSRDSLTLATC